MVVSALAFLVEAIAPVVRTPERVFVRSFLRPNDDGCGCGCRCGCVIDSNGEDDDEDDFSDAFVVSKARTTTVSK
jgi:hypothetical protein